MISEADYWAVGAGSWVPAGDGWGWNDGQILSNLVGITNLKQEKFITLYFYGLDSVAQSIADFGESTASIAWQFKSGPKPKKGNNDPFTIYSVQTSKNTTSNIIYNEQGECVVQVDFAQHGQAMSGHWHMLEPGNLDHDEDHQTWESCPIIWQLVPKKAQQPLKNVGV